MTTVSYVLLFYLTSGYPSRDGCMTQSTEDNEYIEYYHLGQKKNNSATISEKEGDFF